MESLEKEPRKNDNTYIPFFIVNVGLILHLYDSIFYTQNILWTMHAIYTIHLVIRFSLNKQSNFPQYSPTSSTTENNQNNTCKICERVKPPRYYHCRRCDICIYRMNHHCFWLNNCIGQFNGKIYLQILCCFFVITAEHLMYYLCNIIVFQYHYFFTDEVGQEVLFKFLAMRVLIVLVCSFAFFQTFRMFRSHFQSIDENQTLVETYKGVKGLMKKTTREKWSEIMGNNILTWALPTYAGQNSCNIYEEIIILRNQNRKFSANYQAGESKDKENALEVKQYTYADEYIDGPDDEEQYRKLFGSDHLGDDRVLDQ